MRPAAILWDYDGTLVDSAVKNHAFTAALYSALRPGAPLPAALQSVEAYRRALAAWPDWPTVFKQAFGLHDAEVRQVGAMWDAGLFNDPLQPPLFVGLRDVLPQLAALAPMGICSHNSEAHIAATLRRYGVDGCFGAVIGRESLPGGRGKPAADAFLVCLAQLGVQGGEGPLFYIGDRTLDVQFADAAAAALRQQGVESRIVSITACFGAAAVQPAAGAAAAAASPLDVPALIRRFC